LPQVVVLELLFANDGLPFLERFAELLVDFLEVLVLVDCLDSFDESSELHLVSAITFSAFSLNVVIFR
jgi:hypothetical protein